MRKMIIIKKEHREFVERSYYKSSKGTTQLWKNFENIKIGFLGEVVLCDYLHLPKPTIYIKGDKGYDLDYKGMKIDVKVDANNYHGDNGRFIVSEKILSKPMTHFLILMYRKICIEIIGIISKEILMSIMVPCNHGCGTHKTFYCEHKDLDFFNINNDLDKKRREEQ